MANKDTGSYHALADLLIGAKIAFMLRAMAQLRIADVLAEGRQSAETMAQQLGLAADPLRRVMRALPQFGVFEERPDGGFRNTPMSDHMGSDAQPSLCDAILFLNHDVSLKPGYRSAILCRMACRGFRRSMAARCFRCSARTRNWPITSPAACATCTARKGRRSPQAIRSTTIAAWRGQFTMSLLGTS